MRQPVYRLVAAISAIAAASLSFAQEPAVQVTPVGGNGVSPVGRFVWADLFTGDANSAANFYSGMFNWTAEARSGRRGRAFILMRNHGHPVAAIVQRPGGTEHRARWVDYVDVGNVSAAISAFTSDGGHVLAPARRYSRGIHAIVSDNEGSCLGLRQANQPEPASFTPGLGDWAWFELYAQDPQAAGQFYSRVLNYQVVPDSEADSSDQYLLVSGEDHLGGIQRMPAETGAKPDWVGFVEVGDIDAAIAHVGTLGGQVLSDAAPASRGSRFAVVADPTGGIIGLLQYVPGETPETQPAPGDLRTPPQGANPTP